MAQDLTLNVKTTSDVPQAMGRATAATSEFAKQAEAVNKRFKDSFKDIFLSVAGPMAALNLISQKITDYFDKIKQAQEDANKAAIDGVNERMAKEDIYWARKTARENEEKKNKENAARQPQTTAYEFLMNDPRGVSVAPLMGGASNQRIGPTDKTTQELLAERYSNDPKIQEKIRQLIAEDLARNGMISKPGEKPTDFKGPQGFSNVVGVGANPVVEAMTMQLDEQRKHTDLLQQLVNTYGGMPSDFTKQTTAAPSRASLITK